MPLSRAVQFTSERFDYKSELPADWNAGNRFYGRDVAEFLVSALATKKLCAEFLDEDWGWLVFSARGSAPEFEVAIYNLSEHSEGGRPGTNQWGLWMRAYERRKILGLLPKRVEVAVPALVHNAIEQALSATGATPEPWADAPSAA
jgi:hypothetical protein